MKFYILSGRESETLTMNGPHILKVKHNNTDFDYHSPDYKLVSFSNPNKDGISIVLFEIFDRGILGLRTLVTTHSKNVVFK